VDPPGKPVRVTNDAAIDWTPVWAHDGRHLLFASDRGGVMNLWRVPMNENTGEPIGTPEPLTVPTAFVSGFSLTQDGRIVFANTDVRTRVMRLDFDPAREAVTSVSVLLESPRIYRYPDWSPDSETLVFSTFGAAENLHVIRADGSGYRQLTDDDFNNRGPRWFPDGVRVLFYSNRSGTYQAWSIRSDGSSPQQLTHSATSVVLPVLSPAADRIAYRPSMSSRWSIAELRSPGAEHVTDMPPPPQEANISPNSWSKDMSRLALFEQLVAEPRIFVFALATKVYERLPVAGWNPSWLPDGRRLLFSSRQGVQLIDTVTGRTREVYKLTAGLATQNASFALSADGGRIALLALDERSDLWMMNPN
jgi:Tol biopolymer transport system component